jgi:small-conductance mechanosensitive channel
MTPLEIRTGIEIPLPQRDLHLRSADAEAARTLRGD